jgi:hypothetical protein
MDSARTAVATFVEYWVRTEAPPYTRELINNKLYRSSFL